MPLLDDKVQQVQEMVNQLNNIYDQNIPLSGSNILQTKKTIEAFLHEHQASFSLWLEMLWSELRFFENLLTFEGDDYLEYYGHRLSQQALINGCVAILYDKEGNQKMFSAVPQKVDSNGDILSARLFLNTLFLGAPNEETPDYKKYQDKVVSNEIAVFWKFNSLGITQLWQWFSWINILDHIMRILQFNIPFSLQTWAVKTDDEINDQKKQEVEQLVNKRKNWMLIRRDKYGSGDDIQMIEAKSHPNEYSKIDFHTFQNLMNYYTGHYTNIAEKTDRNLSAEVDINNVHFYINQMEWLREAKVFIRDYNKYFNKNASVRFTYDLKTEETEGEQTNGSKESTDTTNKTQPTS